MLGGRGHNNAPSAPAAAAVLGQTGLWGSLMGAPAKVEEETESTDGEDEVRRCLSCFGVIFLKYGW